MVMNGGTCSFVYDRTAGIPAVIEEKKEGGSAVYYFREPGGELIARVKDSSWRYYHFDELGSTRLLTDGNGVATDRYGFDAWGHLLSHTDPVPNDSVAMADDNPYQYVGRLGYYTHHQNAEFGLLQLGVRFYNAEARRFSQVDPKHGDLNRYAYCGSRPLQYADPSGEVALCWQVWYRLPPVLEYKYWERDAGTELYGASADRAGEVTCVWAKRVFWHRIVNLTIYRSFYKVCVDPCRGVTVERSMLNWIEWQRTVADWSGYRVDSFTITKTRLRYEYQSPERACLGLI